MVYWHNNVLDQQNVIIDATLKKVVFKYFLVLLQYVRPTVTVSNYVENPK